MRPQFTTLLCKECRQRFPRSEFQTPPGLGDRRGLYIRCRSCRPVGHRALEPPPEMKAEMRSLSLDDYIQWMLDNGRYSACLETGRIRNLRFDRWLSPKPDRLGYSHVALVFSKGVIRLANVHRVVAISAWGVEAVRGKEVGHVRGVRAGDALNNLWIPESREAHVLFDNSHRGLKRGPKTDWLPCALCGTMGGTKRHDLRTPERITGARFGINGDPCRRCYDQQKRLAKKEEA